MHVNVTFMTCAHYAESIPMVKQFVHGGKGSNDVETLLHRKQHITLSKQFNKVFFEWTITYNQYLPKAISILPYKLKTDISYFR